jgi:hypothetical protein
MKNRLQVVLITNVLHRWNLIKEYADGNKFIDCAVNSNSHLG